MLTIAQQIAGLRPILTGKLKTRQENADDRIRKTFEVLQKTGNAQAVHLAKSLEYHPDTVKVYLRRLKEERKVVSWKVGNNTWYAVARPAKRRK